MDKRTHDRIPVSIEFHCLDMEYFGTVMNISESGMFIKSQKIFFPLKMQFDLSIPCGSKIFNVPVTVRRITKSGNNYSGLGVELTEQPQDYLDFINRLRQASPPVTCNNIDQHLQNVQRV